MKYQSLYLKVFVLFVIASLCLVSVTADEVADFTANPSPTTYDALPSPTSDQFQQLPNPTADEFLKLKNPTPEDFDKLSTTQINPKVVDSYLKSGTNTLDKISDPDKFQAFLNSGGLGKISDPKQFGTLSPDQKNAVLTTFAKNGYGGNAETLKGPIRDILAEKAPNIENAGITDQATFKKAVYNHFSDADGTKLENDKDKAILVAYQKIGGQTVSFDKDSNEISVFENGDELKSSFWGFFHGEKIKALPEGAGAVISYSNKEVYLAPIVNGKTDTSHVYSITDPNGGTVVTQNNDGTLTVKDGMIGGVPFTGTISGFTGGDKPAVQVSQVQQIGVTGESPLKVSTSDGSPPTAKFSIDENSITTIDFGTQNIVMTGKAASLNAVVIAKGIDWSGADTTAVKDKAFFATTGSAQETYQKTYSSPATSSPSISYNMLTTNVPTGTADVCLTQAAYDKSTNAVLLDPKNQQISAKDSGMEIDYTLNREKVQETVKVTNGEVTTTSGNTPKDSIQGYNFDVIQTDAGHNSRQYSVDGSGNIISSFKDNSQSASTEHNEVFSSFPTSQIIPTNPDGDPVHNQAESLKPESDLLPKGATKAQITDFQNANSKAYAWGTEYYYHVKGGMPPDGRNGVVTTAIDNAIWEGEDPSDPTTLKIYIDEEAKSVKGVVDKLGSTPTSSAGGSTSSTTPVTTQLSPLQDNVKNWGLVANKEYGVYLKDGDTGAYIIQDDGSVFYTGGNGGAAKTLPTGADPSVPANWKSNIATPIISVSGPEVSVDFRYNTVTKSWEYQVYEEGTWNNVNAGSTDNDLDKQTQGIALRLSQLNSVKDPVASGLQYLNSVDENSGKLFENYNVYGLPPLNENGLPLKIPATVVPPHDALKNPTAGDIVTNKESPKSPDFEMFTVVSNNNGKVTYTDANGKTNTESVDDWAKKTKDDVVAPLNNIINVHAAYSLGSVDYRYNGQVWQYNNGAGWGNVGDMSRFINNAAERDVAQQLVGQNYDQGISSFRILSNFNSAMYTVKGIPQKAAPTDSNTKPTTPKPTPAPQITKTR